VNALEQLEKVQNFKRRCDGDKDGDVERYGEAELLCEWVEKISEFVEETELDFSPRSNFSLTLDFLLGTKVLSRLGSLSILDPSVSSARG
jgi:hypothetical protein